MRSFDLSPLLRSTVGFDEINRLFENALRGGDGDQAYPPYNIEKSGDDDYRITMAVAGFGQDDLDLTVQDGVLIITGKSQSEDEEKTRNFLYRGIASRAFERRFKLADTIKVVGASFENGLLNVELKREVPEHKKPRKIEIAKTVNAATGSKALTDKAA